MLLLPKTFIVGGHYDASGSRESGYETFWSIHQAQGADDNATGVAATMEMARVLSDPDNDFKSKHNIRFIAFAAEEYHPQHDGYHHLGSLYDAQIMNKTGVEVSGVLVLDMIAYNPNYDYIEVITNTSSTWLADSTLVNGPRYVPDLITNIRFILRQAEHVRVRIVDVRGRELIRLYDNFMAAARMNSHGMVKTLQDQMLPAVCI